MSKNQTISLLGVLEKPELTALGKFVKSPFFTAKKFLNNTFTVMRDLKQKAVEKPERAFARVFPGEAFGDGHKWNKALSDLNACIEEFLIVRQTLDDPHLRIQAGVSALFGRRDVNLFQRKIGAALKDLPGSGAPETTEGWHLRYWTLKRASTYPFAGQIKTPGRALGDLETGLDLYYFISRLQLACNRAIQAQVLRFENDQSLFQQLLDQTAGLDQSGKSALLTLYRALLLLFTVPTAQFGAFFTLLQAQGHRVERSELEPFVLLAFNCCIRRYREGETEAFYWYRQMFDWANGQKVWTVAVAEEIILNTGVMFAKDRDTAGFDTFLEKSKSVLPDERRADAVALLQACRHFYQSEYSDASRLLHRQVGTRHPRYVLLYHSLMVRNTYEEWLLKKVDPGELERALSSFEGFLKRKDHYAVSLRQSYRTLIWFIREMAQCGKKRALSKTQLMEELEGKRPAVRDWVTDKIGRLPD